MLGSVVLTTGIGVGERTKSAKREGFVNSVRCELSFEMNGSDWMEGEGVHIRMTASGIWETGVPMLGFG